jgi:hypothetical protein
LLCALSVPGVAVALVPAFWLSVPLTPEGEVAACSLGLVAPVVAEGLAAAVPVSVPEGEVAATPGVVLVPAALVSVPVVLGAAPALLCGMVLAAELDCIELGCDVLLSVPAACGEAGVLAAAPVAAP